MPLLAVRHHGATLQVERVHEKRNRQNPRGRQPPVLLCELQVSMCVVESLLLRFWIEPSKPKKLGSHRTGRCPPANECLARDHEEAGGSKKTSWTNTARPLSKKSCTTNRSVPVGSCGVRLRASWVGIPAACAPPSTRLQAQFRYPHPPTRLVVKKKGSEGKMNFNDDGPSSSQDRVLSQHHVEVKIRRAGLRRIGERGLNARIFNQQKF